MQWKTRPAETWRSEHRPRLAGSLGDYDSIASAPPASIPPFAVTVVTAGGAQRIKGRNRLYLTESKHCISVCQIEINQPTDNEFNLKHKFFF